MSHTTSQPLVGRVEQITTDCSIDHSQKHCFTQGLMDRLKARASLTRAPAQQSTLPVFLWESPPLAKIYKITFLARLEADGLEGLGFRLDDTVSDTPRQIAWAATVGTPQSPHCLLDGSQTFITHSASKPAERCRKGWHVRIGKVSQIVDLFNNTPLNMSSAGEIKQDSLTIKLSLRKINSSNHTTNPVPQPQPPPTARQDNFQFYKSRPITFHPSSKALQSPATQETRKELDYPSNTKALTRVNTAIIKPPSKLPSPIPFVCTSSPRTLKTIPPSTQLSIENTRSQEGQRHFDLSSQRFFPTHISTPNEPLQRFNHISLPDFSTSSTPLTATIPTAKSIPQGSHLLEAASSIPSCRLSKSTPNLLESTARHERERNSSPSPEIERSVKLDSPADLTPASLSLPDPTETDLKSVTSSLPEISSPAAPAPPETIPADQTAQENPVEMVCFVFPPTANRLDERSLYVPYSELVKVEYFQQALQSANTTLSIDESSAKVNQSLQIVRRGVLTLLRFLPRLAFCLQRNSAQSHTIEIPNAEAKNKGLILTSLVVLTKVGFGLFKLACSSYFEAMRLLFSESYGLLSTFMPQPTDNTSTSISAKTLFALGNSLKAMCRAGLDIQQYLTEAGAKRSRAPIVPSESHICYQSHSVSILRYAVSLIIYDMAVKFAPIQSSFIVQRALADTFSQDELEAALSQKIVLYRQAYINTNSQGVVKQGFSTPDVKLTPCRPTSIYALANRLNLEELKGLAHRQIIRELSPFNIFQQLKTASTLNYKQLA
ncbi:hypothetical protein VP01_1717g2 [Puccinia sorghi]|uniref:Uncharacterized protein n=1 Tax=Puccinia sorghi TaxID=27349 RepID=A0A0L6VFH3_9BASI|nr:hypothetical protein VP01_1717g2 [Puccinia sorghi]